MNIRNFSIIAHIDHGKSTLADRIIEKTGAISKYKMKERMMDTLELEQEKGITIKLQTARMHWKYTGDIKKFQDQDFIMNLIDTPGHVDFTFEVSRSITASEGVILLVDATQGIQAQTISNFYKALDRNLEIIPVISKIDLPNAEIEKTRSAFIEVLGFNKEEILLTSGKTGEGVEKLLNTIVEKVPSPEYKKSIVTKLLIFDSFFHEYKGVVALVKVEEGNINSSDTLYTLQTKIKIDPIEIGYLRPYLETQNSLKQGEVGFIATGLKNIKEIHVGDTITKYKDYESYTIKPITGYKFPKPMIYASLYPIDADNFEEFTDSLEKLSLNDSALTYTKEKSPILGTGYCCGFLGLLHLEVTQERLSREYSTEVFTTTPSVLYKFKISTKDINKLGIIGQPRFDKDGHLLVRTSAEYPRNEVVQTAYEPWVKMEIVTPMKYMGSVIELTKMHRGIYKETEYLVKGEKSSISDYIILRFDVPTAEMITNFFDRLKSISQGYASMDYEFLEYREADIVKISVLINSEPVEALSFITHKDFALKRAKALTEKLRDVIPRQQFVVPIQAAISGSIIARADIKAYRKDVTQKLYGGDVTRKRKLLEKQKKGKKRMKEFGRVEIPREAFLAVLKTD